MRKPLSWYKPGKTINVSDKMQDNYSYKLDARPGKDFDSEFKPELTPQQMLELGVFEGKYLCDCTDEFPTEWFTNAKLSPEKPDISLNLFKIKSRLSLQEWRRRKWIPIVPGDKDIRGWFQWYCRYWIGRRDTNVDSVQIARWKAFTRHKGQILASLRRMQSDKRPVSKPELMKHRPRQRQALLQWAYNPFAKL